MPLRGVPMTPAEQGEPVGEPASDLRHRHHPDLGRGQFDRQRQPVQAGHEVMDLVGVEVGPGPGRQGALPEQGDRVARAQLRQQVDVFGRQAEGCPGGGEHVQRRRPGEQHADQAGDRLDHVLAVVQDEQRRRSRKPFEDLRVQVSPPRLAEQWRDRGFTHPQHRGHLDGHLLRGGQRNQLDQVHHRLFGGAAQQVRQPGLAQSAGAHDRGEAGGADQGRERGDVLLPAHQARRLVAQPLAYR